MALSVVSLVKQLVFIGWFFWSLPFRVTIRVTYYSLITLLAQPIDFAQKQILGREIIATESLVRNFAAAARPFWNRLFPFPEESNNLFVEEQLNNDPPSRITFSEKTERRSNVREEVPSNTMQNEYDDDDTADGSDYFQNSGNINNNFGTSFERASEQSLESDPSSYKLPKAAREASAAEVDKAVMLAIEAKQTHLVVEKLFWVAVMLMTVIGIILVRIDFTRNWQGRKLAGNVEPAMGFEGVYGVLVVLTIAFRADFPFNLGVLMLVVFFSGIVFGTIISRNAFMTLHGGSSEKSNDDNYN